MSISWQPDENVWVITACVPQGTPSSSVFPFHLRFVSKLLSHVSSTTVVSADARRPLRKSAGVYGLSVAEVAGGSQQVRWHPWRGGE